MYFSFLNDDINLHIHHFIISSYANTIIRSWKRYYLHKCFIIFSITFLPRHHSMYNHSRIFNAANNLTYFYFKIFNSLVTGRESYIHLIYNTYFLLALSISDYEWLLNYNNYIIKRNKDLCILTATKFNWIEILNIFD